MKIFMELKESDFYAILLGIIFVFLAANYAKQNRKRGKMPPEPTGSWPIIGHLHLLGGGANQLLHKTLGAIADKHGPIFSIRIGIHPAVVVSSREVAKECFTTNDKVFSTRPKSLALKIMGYGQTMFGFSPYGQYWRDMRKIVTVELLSKHRLELLNHVRETETSLFVKELYEKSVKNGGCVVVEMKERFGDMTMNIIVRMIAGKRYFSSDDVWNDEQEESRKCQKALGDFFYLVGLFLASDAIPFVGTWLDFSKGYIARMKRAAKDLDDVFQSWVNEHRQNRVDRTIKEEERDFINVMLSIKDNNSTNISADLADTAIKATCLSLISGGSETTMVTLTWALSLLLNNCDVLKKAQDELDIQVGKHRQVVESDIKNLVYLQAIVKETLRLYPPGPLSAPREAMEDCVVAGFNIPAGTRLIVNLWKLHRDPSTWANPLEFQPERFLKEHANLDVSGQDFELLPFGSGRRMCPGVLFSLQIVNLTLARLLHGFELGRVSDALVDMSESPGLTLPKATPLEVILRPRLPFTLYESYS